MCGGKRCGSVRLVCQAYIVCFALSVLCLLCVCAVVGAGWLGSGRFSNQLQLWYVFMPSLFFIAEERRVAICVMDDVLEHSPAGGAKYAAQVMTLYVCLYYMIVCLYPITGDGIDRF